MANTFTYFDGRGHGERVRVALCAAGIDFSENLLRVPGDVDAVRPKCLFTQVPLVELADGTRLVQSWATVRYLGRLNGLTPSDPAAAFLVDAAAEQVRDLTVDADLVGFGWSADTAAALDKVRAATARHLPLFERVLEAAIVSPYLTGPTPTWADFQLFYVLDYIEELIPGSLVSHARCAALHAAARATPAMGRYYATYRKRLVDAQYIKEVREAQLPAHSTPA